jgi:hypothetical protein
MVPVVGVFKSRLDAERAGNQLRSAGVQQEAINILAPSASDKQIQAIPVTDTEEPGMGKAVGGVVGGAVGAAAGAELAAIAATVFIPGVGPILAIGVAAVALLAAGGAVGGFFAGRALDEALTDGLPVDDIYVYEAALRNGRTVLIASAHDHAQSEVIRPILTAAGAESVDAARESWWLGLRDDQEAKYRADGLDFKADEPNYRAGFEASQRPSFRGRSYQQAEGDLKKEYPDSYSNQAFRRGYASGESHREGLLNEYKQ